MAAEPLPRLDGAHPEIRALILPLCRLGPGEVWEDPEQGHRVMVGDATRPADISRLTDGNACHLGIHDPPYNFKVGNRRSSQLFELELKKYLDFSFQWLKIAERFLAHPAHLYIWLGADQRQHFQPLPDFMLLMRRFPELKSRSFITMRNQRGYGTQKNWMAVRQELLHYIKGDPPFQVTYTDIPKILRGYYKEVGGEKTDNLARSRSQNIRPGNVWVDIQQVFYRLEENVPGAYAQKPLKSIARLVETSSRPGDLVTDFFAHSGTTLLAAEALGRRCHTLDNDPIFAELSIRRLENYRATGKTGWQYRNPFPEIEPEIKRLMA